MLLLSCEKKDVEMRLPGFDTPIITGFELRGENGEFRGKKGIPNIRLGDKSNDSKSSDYYFRCTPNPTSDYLYIHFKMPADSILKRIWITQAIYYTEENSESEIDPNLAKIGGTAILEFETIENFFFIEMKKFENNGSSKNNGKRIPDGFYRVYVQTDNVLLWDNIYFTNQ